MPFGTEGLVVTWTVPVPKEAKVVCTGGQVFDTLDKAAGGGLHPDLPRKYTQGLQKSSLFNAHLSWEPADLVRWEKRHGIEMQEKPMAAFKQYLSTDHVIFGTLVSHPKVPDPKRWIACSVILQRGVIVMDPAGHEQLFLRSYFHSAQQPGKQAPGKGGGEEQEAAQKKGREQAPAAEAVNFVTDGGLEITFASKAIWYPMALTEFIDEPASYLVLDILTQKPWEAKELPQGLSAAKKAEVDHRGRRYHVTRITGKLDAGRKWPDLNLKY